MKLSISRPDNLVVSWLVVVFCRCTTSLLSNRPCLYTLHMQQSVRARSQHYTRPFHYVTEQDKTVSIHIISYTCTSTSLSLYATALVSRLNRSKRANKLNRDQLDVICCIISLLNAQHVSDVNTSILRSLPLICWVISWVVLIRFDVCWCYFVATPTHIEPDQYNPWNNSTNKSQAPEDDVLTFETCWALSNEIINQVTSSWSLFIQLSRWCTVQ